jgi:pimeloyl-ACP methyl ester carboxylesterase
MEIVRLLWKTTKPIASTGPNSFGTPEGHVIVRTIAIAGTTLELVEQGQGRPLLFLHAGEGLMPERAWLDLLAQRYRVIAPSHPGWGNSPLIDGSGSVDDLAYLYLDLAKESGSTMRCWWGRVLAVGSRPR